MTSGTGFIRTGVLLAVLLLPGDAAPQQPGTLYGTVVLAHTGDGVEGARVHLLDLDRVVVTDDDGRFEMIGVPPAIYHLLVSHDLLEPFARRVRIDEASAVELRIALVLRTVRERITVSAVDLRNLLPQGLDGTPGIAGTLSADDIRRYRPYTLHDALRLVPGVRAVDDDALGRRAGIGIRGAVPRRSRRVLMLEDGVPINAATYLDPDGHYTPPLERLERIDVLKGAGQIVHGPLNHHGIINFRTVRPTAVPETVIDLGLGTLGTVRRHALHRRTMNRLGLVFGYTGMNADGVFDTEAHRYDDLFGSVEWALHPRHDLAGSVTYFRERSHFDERNLSVEEFASDPRSKIRLGEGAEFNTLAVDYLKGHLSHRARPAEHVTLASHVFVTDLDRPRFQSRRGGPDAAGGYMRGRERRYTTIGGESRLQVSGRDTGAVRRTWETGLRWEQQRFDNRNTVGRVGEVLDPSARGVLAVRDDLLFREDGRRETLAAWAVSGFVRHAVTAGTVTVTPGLRVERYLQRRTLAFRPGTPVPDSQADSRTLALPGIGVRYDGLPATQVYAGAHRGYAPALARTDDFPLVPETGLDLQVGIRSQRLTGLTLDAGVFANRLRNTLLKKTFTDRFGANIFLNSGDSRAWGVDVGARLDSRAFTGALLNAFVQTAYTYTEARFANGPVAGRFVPGVPLHAGSLTAGLEHAAGWSASATLDRQGGFFSDERNTRVLSAPDPAEPLELVGFVPGRTLLSARIGYQLPGRTAALWVQGRNLTDRLYISDVQDGLRPGPARTISAGIRMSF